MQRHRHPHELPEPSQGEYLREQPLEPFEFGFRPSLFGSGTMVRVVVLPERFSRGYDQEVGAAGVQTDLPKQWIPSPRRGSQIAFEGSNTLASASEVLFEARDPLIRRTLLGP